MFRSPLLLIIVLIAVAGSGQKASSQIFAASQTGDRPSWHDRFQPPTLTSTAWAICAEILVWHDACKVSPTS